MKRFIFHSLVFILLVGCTPSPKAVPTSISGNQNAVGQSPTAIPTISPTAVKTINPSATLNADLPVGTAGTPYLSHGFSILVSKVEKLKNINDFVSAPEGKIFLDLTLEISPLVYETDYHASCGIGYFSVRDDQGNIYRPLQFSPHEITCPQANSSQGVYEISSVGQILFSVPESAKGLILVFEPPGVFPEGRTIADAISVVLDEADEASKAALSQPFTTAIFDGYPTTSLMMGKIGDLVESHLTSIQVFGVQEMDSIPNYRKPMEGNRFLVIDVEINHFADIIMRAGPISTDDDFTISDSDHNSYYPLYLPYFKPRLQGLLRVGESTRGFLTFEVPSSAKGLNLVYPDWNGDFKIDIENQDRVTIKDPLPIVGFDFVVEPGKKVELSELAATINGITEKPIKDLPAPGEWVVLDMDMTLENISIPDILDPGDYHLGSFRLVDEKGISYLPDTYAEGCQKPNGPILSSGRLKLGDPERVHLCFSVPASIPKFIFSFSPINYHTLLFVFEAPHT